jgi:hypothetical protein
MRLLWNLSNGGARTMCRARDPRKATGTSYHWLMDHAGCWNLPVKSWATKSRLSYSC